MRLRCHPYMLPRPLAAAAQAPAPTAARKRAAGPEGGRRQALDVLP